MKTRSTGNVTDPAYRLEVLDVAGFADTLVDDLSRADATAAERVELRWRLDETDGTQTVEIRAADDNAAKWLYDWFEDSKEHYRTQYVNTPPEYRAAEDLASAWYDEVAGR